jgi:hypothetical protein
LIDERNPYQPPEAELGINRKASRYRPLARVVRVLVGLWGLMILAGSSRDGGTAAYHHGQVAGKAVGAILFMVAVFPLRRPRVKKPESGEVVAEEL